MEMVRLNANYGNNRSITPASLSHKTFTTYNDDERFQRYILPDSATKDALIALDRNSDDILTLIVISEDGRMLGLSRMGMYVVD